MSSSRFLSALLLATAFVAVPASAQLKASDAWIRATAPGQTTAAVYVRLQSSEAVSVVGVSSPVAKSAAVHETTNEGGVSKMRDVKSLDVPKGGTLEMKPNGHHVMLMDLTHPLKPGEQVPLTLTVRDAHGKTSTLDVSASVLPLTTLGTEPHRHTH